jgi:hypothetical protein
MMLSAVFEVQPTPRVRFTYASYQGLVFISHQRKPIFDVRDIHAVVDGRCLRCSLSLDIQGLWYENGGLIQVVNAMLDGCHQLIDFRN